MAVRKQYNRYKTEPSGKDFEEVLKKAKTFFRNTGRFEIAPFGGVYTTTGETVLAILYRMEQGFSCLTESGGKKQTDLTSEIRFLNNGG